MAALRRLQQTLHPRTKVPRDVFRCDACVAQVSCDGPHESGLLASRVREGSVRHRGNRHRGLVHLALVHQSMLVHLSVVVIVVVVLQELAHVLVENVDRTLNGVTHLGVCVESGLEETLCQAANLLQTGRLHLGHPRQVLHLLVRVGDGQDLSLHLGLLRLQ